VSSIVEQQPAGVSRALSTSRERRFALLAGALTVILLAATLEIVLDAAVGHSALIPKQPDIAKWMSGVGERLGYRVFLIALLAYTGAFVGMVALARQISTRWAIALTAALQLIVFAGPILISTDVFSYIAYARMGVEHGVNPYLHGPISISGDPVYRYVGKDWIKVATAYGPLYTLLSYPLAPLGVTGALWGMKFEALLASAGTLALTWRCARMRGLDPKFALIAVGVNPLWVIYGLGGAHNDLIMTLFLMGAVALTLVGERGSRDEIYAGAAVLGATLIKATGIVLLPFMLLSRRRIAPLIGVAVAGVGCAIVAYAVFGIHGVDIVSALHRDSAFVSSDAFPTEIAHLFGKPGVFPIDHDLLEVVLVLIVLHLLWRTWRGYDWVAASGWALLAIVVASTWLLAWYTLWALPLAAISRDRRLLYATFAVQGLFIVHQLAPLVAPVS
jgi:Glycosyltransferase family 87